MQHRNLGAGLTLATLALAIGLGGCSGSFYARSPEDYRVATRDPKTRIGLNEVALGVQFPPKVLGMTRRRVPPRSLERVVLEAGLHDPETAYALGLVDELADDCLGTARARLERLAAHPRAAYVATKRGIRGSLALTPHAARLGSA